MISRVVLVAGGVALASLGFVGGASAQTVSGDLSAGFGAEHAPFGYDPDAGIYSFSARASVPFSTGAWNVEAEVNGQGVFSGYAYPSLADGYIHLWNRLAGSAWGPFVGTSFSDGRGSIVGAEFKHFLPDMSYGLAGGVLFSDSDTGFAGNASFNYYFNPNHRIGFKVAVVSFDYDTTWQVKADFEHRLNQPFGLWASVSTFGSSREDGNPWTALGGVRIYLDRPGSTIQSHEMDVPFEFKLPVFAIPSTT